VWVAGMSNSQKAGVQREAVRSCKRCVHKPVCILYHGHSELEFKFVEKRPENSAEYVKKLDEQLALKCQYYLESGGKPAAPKRADTRGARDAK